MPETIGAVGAHSPKIRKRRLKIRQTLVEESAILFAERGIDQVSVDEIIDQAGIAKSTFYTFFPSKSDLVAGILSPVFASGAAALDSLETADGSEIVEGIADIYLDLWTEYHSAFLMVNQLDMKYFELVQSEHEMFGESLEEALSRISSSSGLRTKSPAIARKIMAQCAIPLLQIYESAPNFHNLFRSSLTALLLDDAQPKS